MAFKQTLVGTAEFANGRAFKIEQVKRKGTCVVTDLNSDKQVGAVSVAAAWAKVRYMSGITHRTENTTGWPKRRVH